MNELDLFTEALSRTDPAERAAFLDQACAGNPELRRRLEKLLAGHAQAENPLDRPPVAPGEFGATVEQPTPSSTRESPPEVATEAFDHTHPDATSALEIGRQRTPYDRVDGARTGRGHSDVCPARSQCHHGSGTDAQRSQARDGRTGRNDHRRPVHAGRGDRRRRHGLGLSGQPDRAGQASGGAQADQDGHGFAGRARPVRRRAAGPGDDGPPQHRPHLRWRRHPGWPAVLRHGIGGRGAAHTSIATSSG